MSYDAERYDVVRYPAFYAVIDKQDENRVVFETRTRARAHSKAKELNTPFLDFVAKERENEGGH